MATATATESTRTSGVKPFATVTFTGGTADDRLLLSDIAAAHSSLTYDDTTGRLTQSDSTARTYIIGTSGALTRNTFVDIPSGVVQLLDNEGDDTSALDRGNTTSKFIFGAGADVVVGQDNGEPAYSGRLIIRGANYSYDFFRYADLCEADAQIVCHGEIILAGRNNSRFQVQNSNASSNLMVVEAGDNASVDPFAANDASGSTPKLNLAPGFDGSLRIYGLGAAFRFSLDGSGVMEIAEIVTSDSTNPPTIYIQQIDSSLNHAFTVAGLRPSVIGTSGASTLRFLLADYTTDLTLTLRDFRGSRDDTDLLMGSDDANCTVESNQSVKVDLIDPAGNAVTGKIRLSHADYVVNFQSDPTPPTITIDDDGNTAQSVNTSTMTQRVLDKVWAKRQTAGRQDFEDSDSNVVSAATPGSPQLSAFVWGREYVLDMDIDLDSGHEDGEQTIALGLAEDTNVTAATKDAVPSTASTFDDIYDMLAEHAYDNNTEIAGSVSFGALTLDSTNIVFALGGSLMVSSGSVTVPCAAEVTAGDRITSIVVTGTSTINTGVEVNAPITNSSGKRVFVNGLPSGHAAVVGAWPASQGEDTRTNIITARIGSTTDTSIAITLDPDTTYFLVSDAVSYLRHVPVRFDPSTSDSIDMSLRKITDAAGDDLVPAAGDLTSDETTYLDMIDYDVSNDTISFGATSTHNEYPFKAVARAIEVGQSMTDALADPYVCIIQTGSFSFMSDATRMLQRAASIDDDLVPDLSAFQFSKIGSTDQKDFVDYSDGAIIVNSGVPAVVSVDVDDVNITQDTFDERLEAFAVESGVSFLEAMQIVLAALVGQTTANESGGNTTLTMKRVDSAATDVWETTVDGSGNRTSSAAS